MTARTFVRRPSPEGCGRVAFAATPAVYALVSPRRYTPCPVMQNGWCNPAPPVSYQRLSTCSFDGYRRFRANTVSIPNKVQALFHPLSRGTFQLSLTLLLRYRTQDVFSVGRTCLPKIRRGFPTPTTREHAQIGGRSGYGTFTLSGAPFQATFPYYRGSYSGPSHHIHVRSP